MNPLFYLFQFCAGMLIGIMLMAWWLIRDSRKSYNDQIEKESKVW